MSNDSDACVPKALVDFVFDLYDSVSTSQIVEEQTRLYNTVFRDLSFKYFANTAWPSPKTIASECNGHPLFLCLYREQTHRHWHSVSRIGLRDYVEGWQVYRELFEEILEEGHNFYIVPGWAFDILNEFVYQFQGFCQTRSSLHANAVKHGILPEGSPFGTPPPSNTSTHTNLVENLNVLATSDAWNVEQVFSYLHRLVQIGKTSTQPAYQYLGIFASVTLSRLECLLGDYTASLQALTPISESFVVKNKDEDPQTAVQVVQSVFLARLSTAYHAGVSLLMLRRYKDAARTWGSICAYMQRGFKTGQLRKLPHSDQFNKQYERMIALLAIVTHICPSQGIVEDSVLKTVREKHGSMLSKVDAGEEGYEDLFLCPKFVSVSPDVVYKLQIKKFVKEMAPQHTVRKLRSYLKLYTSIATTKLAKFNDMEEENEFVPLLLSFKYRMRQLESSGLGGEGRLVSLDGDGGTTTTLKSALDIHFYLVGDMVHIDEAEKQRRFEKYFVQQIFQNSEIMKEAETIDPAV